MRKRTQQGIENQHSNHTARLALALPFPVLLSMQPIQCRGGREGCCIVHGRVSRANTQVDSWGGPHRANLFLTPHCSRVTNSRVDRDRESIAWEAHLPAPYCSRRTTLKDRQPAPWEAEHRLLTSHHWLNTGPDSRNGPCLAQPATPRTR